MLTTFSSRSQSSRVFIMSSTKHIELHARSKPTFTIACTIIIVIMYEVPNRTLQVLNPVKTNNRNRIFNGSAKLRYLTLLFKLLLSVSLSNSLLLAPAPSKLCSRTFLIFQQMRCYSLLSNPLSQFCQYFRSLESHMAHLFSREASMNFAHLASLSSCRVRGPAHSEKRSTSLNVCEMSV